MNAAYASESHGPGAAPPLSAHEEAARMLAHVQRIALDLESSQSLLNVPVRLIPYVERIRSLRRDLAREQAARAALQRALERLVEEVAVRKKGLKAEG
jgi:hypothetical protein